MKHLTVDEMIDFVSIKELNNESLTLAKKVNAHIMNCDSCREQVAAFQTVYDEFVRLAKSGELSGIFHDTANKESHEDAAEEKQLDNFM